MLPIATGGTRIGRIIKVRINPLARGTPLTINARAKPSTSSTATDTTTKVSVFLNVTTNSQSVARWRKFSRPVNVQRCSPCENVMLDTLIISKLIAGYTVRTTSSTTAGINVALRNHSSGCGFGGA